MAHTHQHSHSPAAAGGEGGQSSRPETCPPTPIRGPVPQACKHPPARTAGHPREIVCGCATLREEEEGRCPPRPSLSGPHSPASSPSLPAALLLRNASQPGPVHSLRASLPGLGDLGRPALPPALPNPPPLLRSLLNDSDLSIHFPHRFLLAPCVLLACGYKGSLLKS